MEMEEEKALAIQQAVDESVSLKMRKLQVRLENMEKETRDLREVRLSGILLTLKDKEKSTAQESYSLKLYLIEKKLHFGQEASLQGVVYEVSTLSLFVIFMSSFLYNGIFVP